MTSYAFDLLVEEAALCRLCGPMGCAPVLSQRNGPAPARLMFVAEAPGRLGGAITGIPLSADETGRRFARWLADAGIERSSVFVTNAVLCNPLDARGRNRPPSRRERANCGPWLARQIDAVAPDVVVVLGAVALAALEEIAPHGLTLRSDVGRAVPWQGRTLVALYHPSPRTRAVRTDGQHSADYRALAALVESVVR
ncbi:MAG: uracil-DNA glycosylase [Dehalococcoidia bacterium]|nr:uracil-DNA glycosylase [Dehalococcoidia bacterium]